MKQLGGVFIVTALAGLAAGVDAAELRTQGYTNADLVGGYACDVSGTFGGSRVVEIAQFRPEGDGTFSQSALALHVDGIGVCAFSLKPGSGSYDLSPNGAGLARLNYSRQRGSAKRCPPVFSSHLGFVTSGTTCDIATLDAGVLLSGSCKKQNKTARAGPRCTSSGFHRRQSFSPPQPSPIHPPLDPAMRVRT